MLWESIARAAKFGGIDLRRRLVVNCCDWHNCAAEKYWLSEVDVKIDC